MAELASALDAAPRPVEVFFRDDDAGWEDTRLLELVARFAEHGLPVDLAVIPAELPGYRSDIRVTRPELEQLIAEPLAGLLSAIDDTLQRNNIAPAQVSAVATVGGGAAIPLITQRLSERLRAPVITTPESHLNIAAGAALVANQSGIVSPALMHWSQSGALMVMVILGGVGHLYGGFVGAVVLLLLEEIALGYTIHWQFGVGAVLLLVVLVAPKGLMGLINRSRA